MVLFVLDASAVLFQFLCRVAFCFVRNNAKQNADGIKEELNASILLQ